MTIHTITIIDTEFQPVTITIHKGDSIQWKNSSGMAHTATRTSAPSFDTGRINPSTTSTPIVFDDSSNGPLEYFCRPHPFMTGTINVV
jgi:plastocyanin